MKMKQIVVGIDEARMVDDKGNIYRATKIGDRWIFQGSVYASPFEAFKEVIE